MIVTIGVYRNIQEALSDGERPLIDSSGYTSLQQHLQQFGVCWGLRETLPESSDLVLHTQNGHLERTQVQLREEGKQRRGKERRRKGKEGEERRGR